jgi:hypothetical protein
MVARAQCSLEVCFMEPRREQPGPIIREWLKTLRAAAFAWISGMACDL